MLTVSILLALFVLPIQDVAGTINAGFVGQCKALVSLSF